jgi:ABC-type dipeptide/oligopeptide/nickel transport system permease subunit
LLPFAIIGQPGGEKMFGAFWMMFWPKKVLRENDEHLKKTKEIQEKKPSIMRDIWQGMIKKKIVIFSLVYLGIFFLIGIYTSFVGFTDGLPKEKTTVFFLAGLAFFGVIGIYTSLKRGFGESKNKIMIFLSALLLLFCLVGLANQFDLPLTPYDYEEIDYQAVRAGPSLTHWFGTDLIGRDMLTRVIFSMGTSVMLAILVVLFGGLIPGVTLGHIAGYFGGWIDEIIMRGGELLANVPPFFMFLYLTLSLRPRYDEFFYSFGGIGEWLLKEGIVDFSMIFIVFSMFYWLGSARVIRSQVLSLREMPYVDSARVLGASSFRIIIRHILPNNLGIIVLWMFQAMGAVVLTEVGLSFFGLGIRPPHPSFGVLFSENINSIRILDACPHLLIFPGIIASVFILSFAFLEMNLNSILNSLYKKGGGEK